MSLFCFISKYLNMISRHSLILPTLLLANNLHAEEVLTEQMQTLAEQFVYSQMVIDPTSQVEVTAAPIDNRHAMHSCDEHLTASVAGNGDIKRNTTVKLSCEAEPRWELYVPVRVMVLRPFVTVNDAITKGSTLTSTMLKVDFMDEVLMRGDTFTEVEPLIGSRSKRDLRPGQPVRQNQICVVCRDDTVEIEATTTAISIKTSGKALQDGTFGQTIRVENLRSHRVITATVEAVGQVRVKM
jgi:flagellar basal body P-ring formation protein FlgA